MVPLAECRGPIHRLTALGGSAIIDEAAGFGHLLSGYTEGLARADNWASKHSRPEHVRTVHYTAIDQLACGAYWVEVAEWGTLPDGRPYWMSGVEHDEYARIDGVWLHTRMKLRTVFFSPYDQGWGRR